jgi:hypothetical protein
VEGRSPLNVDAGTAGRGEGLVRKIGVHETVDTPPSFRAIPVVKVDFREDEVQGGGRVPGGLFDLIPKMAILGKLVAGDNRPFFQVDARSGKENLGDACTQRRQPFFKCFIDVRKPLRRLI